jgi:hypothetical protein
MQINSIASVDSCQLLKTQDNDRQKTKSKTESQAKTPEIGEVVSFDCVSVHLTLLLEVFFRTDDRRSRRRYELRVAYFLYGVKRVELVLRARYRLK